MWGTWRKVIAVGMLAALFAGLAPALPALAQQEAAPPERTRLPITLPPLLWTESGPDEGFFIFLWPLYHYSREHTYRRHAVLESVLFSTEGDPARDFRRTRLLWPLGEFRREGDRVHNRLLPLYLHNSRPGEYRTFVLPSYFSGASGDHAYRHLWPLFGWDRRGTRVEVSTLYPLFRYARDPQADETDLHAPWPLVRFHRQGDRVHRRIIPLYAYSRQGERSRGYAGLFYWNIRPDIQTRALFPVWYAARAPDRQTDLILPLWYRSRTANSDFLSVLGIGYIRSEDRSRDRLSRSVLFPLFNHTREGPVRRSWLFPLYAYRFAPGYSRIITPLYWYRHSGEDTSRTLFPLHSSRTRGDWYARRWVLGPAYVQTRDDRLDLRRTSVLWPLFSTEQKGDTHRSWLLPVYYRRDTPAEFRFYSLPYWYTRTPQYTRRTVPPVYWSYASEAHRYRYLLPLYGESWKGTYHRRWVLGPAYVQTRDEAADLRRTSVLFPLFSTERRGDTHRSWLLPVYYRRDTPAEHRFYSLPYWYTRTPEYTRRTVPPLYWSYTSEGHSYRYLLPLYGDLQKGTFRRLWVLGPAYVRTRDEEADLRRTSVLFPLFSTERKGESRRMWLFPAFYHRSSPELTRTVSLPYWYFRKGGESWRTVVPFYSVRRKGAGYARRWYLGPLLVTTRDDGRDLVSRSVLFPLFHQRREGDASRVWVLPLFYRAQSPTDYRFRSLLYWRTRTPDYDFRTVFPFVGVKRKGDWYTMRYFLGPLLVTVRDDHRDLSSQSVLFPLFHRKRMGEMRESWLAPVYYRKSAPERAAFRSLLYWHTRTPDYTRRNVFPLYWSYRSAMERYRYLLPFYGERRKGEHYLRRWVLGPVYVNTQDEATDLRRTSVLFPLFSMEHKGESHRSWLLPVYYRETAPDRARFLSLPYWHWRKGEESWRIVLPVYGSHLIDDEYARQSFLGPVYVRTRDDAVNLSRHSALFALFSTERKGEARRSWLFPIYYHSAAPNRFLLFTLPYWHWRENTETWRVVPPLYVSHVQGDWYAKRWFLGPVLIHARDDHARHRRLSVLYPLFHSERTGNESTRWLVPFFYQEAGPNSETLYTLLYWRQREGERRSDTIFPFYHLQRRGDWYARHRVLGILYTHMRDLREDYRQDTVLWPLFNRERRRDTRTAWVVPFYYGKSQPGRHFAIGSLALLPPYYVRREEGNERLLHVWPLYGFREKGSYREHSVLWPLVRFGHDTERQLSVAQVLLFHRKATPDKSTTTLLPMWRHERRLQRVRDMTPLLTWYEHDRAAQSTRLSVLYLVPNRVSLFRYQRSPGRMAHGLFPLWGYDRDQQTGSLRWSVLWPLFSQQRDRSGVTDTDVLWKVVTYERTGPQARKFRLLWVLAGLTERPDFRRVWAGPFYYAKREGETTYWNVLGGLFGRETLPDGRSRTQILWLLQFLGEPAQKRAPAAAPG